MNKTRIILIAIVGFALLGSVASALGETARPGYLVPLKLDNFAVETKGAPILPNWQPQYAKFYIMDPYGKTVYMKETTLSAKQLSGSITGTAKWSISGDAGTFEIPAFAASGMWTVRAKIYDINHLSIITWSNSAETTTHSIYVQSGSTWDSLNAPVYLYFSLLGYDIALAFPDLIILIGIIILIVVIILNIWAFRRKRKYAKA